MANDLLQTGSTSPGQLVHRADNLWWWLTPREVARALSRFGAAEAHGGDWVWRTEFVIQPREMRAARTHPSIGFVLVILLVLVLVLPVPASNFRPSGRLGAVIEWAKSA